MQVAANRLGPLMHTNQPKTSALTVLVDPHQVKAHAIIADYQLDQLSLYFQYNACLLRTGMLSSVDQRLLSNAKKRSFRVEWQAWLQVNSLYLHRNPGMC